MQCTKCGQELPVSAAFCPCCGEKNTGGNQDAGKPVYTTEVKGLLKSGKLAVYRDRVEFSTSSAQKTVFDFESLVSVKKRLLPTPAILFITEDARTESCSATSKNIHEAFLYVEQAVRPYLEARKTRLLAQGIRYSFVSSMGMTNSGILSISDDRVEFQSKSGQKETISFQTVKAAAASAGTLDLFLFEGGTKSFGLDKELREEVLDYVRQSLKPYLEERRKALLEKGIYYSFVSSLGQERGTINILADRVEFAGRSGRAETIAFRNIRKADRFGETLELSMTDGTTKAFAADRGEQDEILAFVRKAMEPYVRRRTEGFDTVFGSNERVEFNRERSVFHIIRQNGAVITEEFPQDSIVKCQQTESAELNPMINGIRMGGKAIANKAAEMTGRQGAEEEERIRSVDILLTIQSDGSQWTETLRFGDFPLGITRTSPKYAQSAAQAAGLTEYLRENCSSCEVVLPALPEPEPEEETLAIESGSMQQTAEPAAEAASVPAEGEDLLGVQKYIGRISQYISTCETPMTIAFQGSSGGVEGNLMKMLSCSLEEHYKENRIWLHAKQLSLSNLGEKLPMLIGATLVSQLGGTGDGRVVKFAKAFINLSITLISQGNSDGQFLIDAFFKENSKSSLEDLVKTFSELVKKKADSGNGKVIVFVDGLDSLAPAKTAVILEAMEDFFDCEGCVFAVAVDYASVIRGVNDRYGQDEDRGKSFFNKIFRVSFRLPASGFQMENYVKSRLERLELAPEDETEVKLYSGLLTHSVGNKPESIGHLFDSFRLLKTLADEDIYRNKDARLILFGLLCMQTRFLQVYDQLVKMMGTVTPELLMGLCGADSDVVASSGLAETEKEDFREFARVFCDIINADNVGGISLLECGMFAQVLEFSSITSR